MPGIGVELVVFKPETVVSVHCDGVATEDLEGELATASLNGELLGCRQQGLGNTLTAYPRVHNDIVHIQERLGFEG